MTLRQSFVIALVLFGLLLLLKALAPIEAGIWPDMVLSIDPDDLWRLNP